MTKRFFFLFIMLLLAQLAYSQEYFELNTIVKNKITYKSLPPNGYGKKMLNLMGLDNNVSVHGIELNTKSRLLVRISRDAHNKLNASISLTRVSIEGSIVLRDFEIDSLLWPSGFTANLTLYNGRHKRGVVNISASAHGILKTIDLSYYLPSNIGDISATISDLQFNYSENSYNRLQNISETISYYYSFGILLKKLIKQQAQSNQNSNLNIEAVFIDKILVDRVNDNIKSYNFKTRLNLRDNDPIGFLKLEKKIQRISNRVKTLATQQFSSNSITSANSVQFSHSYCLISLYYLSEAKKLQPSDASGFEDIAKIDTSENARNTLEAVISYYTNSYSIDSIKISQAIFNGYVSMANAAIIESNYTDALLLLNNSLIIHNWFNVELSIAYNNAVSIALDGIASSYLSVGDVALSANNQSLAKTYFNKADKTVMSNEKIFASLQNTDTAFSSYLGLQYRIAIKYIDNESFKDALTRLSYGKNVCSKLNSSNICLDIDSASCIAHAGLINYKLDSLDNLISAGQFPDAYLQLEPINNYVNNNSCFIADDSTRFTEVSYLLFLAFLNNGEILIDAQQSEMALYSLLKAKRINTNYLLNETKKLDILIQFAAEPEITKLIDEAKYHTWANRMEKAATLSLEAKELNNKYFNGANTRINKALKDLDIQMASRSCISYATKYSDIIKKAHIAIKYNNYSKLGTLFDEAQFYISSYPNCSIQNSELLELKQKYASILEYYREYDRVVDGLYQQGYSGVIEKYISLIEFYNDNNLVEYKIVIPDIKSFIEAQNLLNLTMATANYYLKNKLYYTGLEYIEIYRIQGGDAKTIKAISNGIAANLAKHDEEINRSAKEAITEYTKGKRWYNSFKLAYFKNRIVN
ncbi:MAG: hypothetical protein QM503_07995 [Bacteroidota bacterium]